jgi:hypothetical protein
VGATEGRPCSSLALRWTGPADLQFGLKEGLPSEAAKRRRGDQCIASGCVIKPA